MKKLKRNNSLGVDKFISKEPQTARNPKNQKPKGTKKNPAHPVHKQSTSLEPTHQKDKFFKPPLKKNVTDRKTKQRSSSMLDGKKTAQKCEPQEKNQNGTFSEFYRRKKIKEQVDTIDQLQSFRLQQVATNPKLTQKSRYFSQMNKQKGAFCSFKQILIQDSDLQFQSFNLKQQQHQQINISASQKQQFIDKIQHLQKEIEIIKQQKTRKLAGIQQEHMKQTKELKDKIEQLENTNLQLTQKNSNLQSIISHQQIQISTQNEIRQTLESTLKSQVTLKEQLQKSNLASQNKVKALQQQLHSFESNLADFQKMKETYEVRLYNLQKEKKKIKGTALQLLQMLQKQKLAQKME